MRQLFATPPACLLVHTWLKKYYVLSYFSVLGSVEKIFDVHISKYVSPISKEVGIWQGHGCASTGS